MPTFHLSLSEKVKSLTDFDRDVDTAHYGVSQAICIGDIGIFLSYKLINQTDFDDDVKNRAHIFFTDILLMTCLGQMADVELPYYKKSNKNFEKEIMEICENKTAHYTITGPLLLGAILAGLTNKKELEKIKYFGKNLGIAFQIKDDVLGVFGSETEIGKSNTSDIDEGKMTLLYWYTLESDIKSEEKEYLKSHYGIGKLQTEDYNKIKNLITISGAKERVQMKETFYCNQAIECIRDFNISEKNKSFLLDFVHLLIKRNK